MNDILVYSMEKLARQRKIFLKVLYLVFILSACGSWKSNFNLKNIHMYSCFSVMP